VPALTITSENESLAYGGLNHISLGNATLSLNTHSNQLTVGNIGTNGQDGVSIALPGNLIGLDVQWLPLDDSNCLPAGSYIQEQMIGTANGITNGVLGTLTLTAGATNYELSADFSAIGASTCTVQAYSHGVLAAQWTNGGGMVGTCIWTSNTSPSCGISNYTMIWDTTTNIYVQVGTNTYGWQGPDSPISCDCIAVTPMVALSSGSPTALNITASNVPFFTLTAETVSPSVVSLSQTGRSVTLQWFGTGVLQQSFDLNTWSDVSGATAPYTVPISGTNQFFLIKQP
jgi:hypothetical protein